MELEIYDEGQFIRVIQGPVWEYTSDFDGKEMLKRLERVIRTCYKSEDKITDGSAERMVGAIIKSGHTAMLEHESVTVRIVCSRGLSHEIVRHRHCGFAQESSRYCSYDKDKFGNKITVVKPVDFEKGTAEYVMWKNAMENSAQAYFDLKNLLGVKNDMARGVLPTDLKTEIVVTASLREWRAIFGLRCANDAHPEIRLLTRGILTNMSRKIPVVFDDLAEKFLEKVDN